VLELREKMGDLAGAGGAATAGGAPVEDGAVPLARAALVELGYNLLEADKLLSTLDAALPVEELVRQALVKR
jgi:Holliday junction resolvasome RuvABC DNA-binding subunit